MSEAVSDPLLALVRERGMLDDLQMEEVMQEHLRSGKPVVQVIQDYGLIDGDSLLQIVAAQLGTMVVTLDEEAMTPEVIAANQRLQGMSGDLPDTGWNYDLQSSDQSIAALSDGGYVIAWNGFTASAQGYDVFVQRYNEANAPVGRGLDMITGL